MNFEEILVFNFASGERTIKLSEYCFKKLGFRHIITLDDNTGFTEKFKYCAKLAVESNFKTFVRSDADRLVFSGILDLLEKYYEENLDCYEGDGHEYFMNRFRGATPHIFSRNVFEILNENNSLMPDVQKPENFFINTIVKKKLIKEKTYKILTNLHEYEQYPSKVCNSFLNRHARGHLSYYSVDHLNTLHDYKNAIQHALNMTQNRTKQSMDHEDFAFLDTGFEKIKDDESVLESYYKKYSDIYENLNIIYRKLNENINQ
jgi:hypothetical protein